MRTPCDVDRASPTAAGQALVLFSCLALVLAIPATQGADDGPDAIITIQTAGPPLVDGPAGWVVFHESRHGERYEFLVDIPETFSVVEMRVPDDLFDVERAQQIVPWMNVSQTHFPLFAPFPRADVWNATSPAQVYAFVDAEATATSNDDDHVVLRLGLRGPIVGKLDIHRDVEPPTYEVEDMVDLRHNGFLQNTTTSELAIGDLQVRAEDHDGEEDAWVVNPTPAFAYTQRFPVIGLDANTTYQHRIVFRDWAGNEAVTETTTFTTPPKPNAGIPTIQVLQPMPDATHVDPDAEVQVRIDAADPDAISDVRFFLDLQERTSGWTFDDGLLRYRPPEPLAEGLHRASVEVYDVHGNQHYEQWSFTVGAPVETTAAPGPGALVGVAPVVLALAMAASARRKR